ncbi:HDOD domain-containing protein, partial [bacterium]|nr:HDOD domain-containing protein [bacterium]
FASINDPKVGARQLAEIITNDQTLTTKVLKLVNSSFFGLRGKVKNIHHAVTMLGFSTLRQLCLGVSICNSFKNMNSSIGITGESFWEHSISTAIIAKKLASENIDIDPDICYTVGLIHDIGKMLLLEYHIEPYMEALKKAKNENVPLCEAEISVLEVDHPAVANWLFRKWKLPRDIRRAAKNHHSIDPDNISLISEDVLTGIIYFANELSHHYKIGDSGNHTTHLEEQKFKKFFGMSVDEMAIDKVEIEEETQISIEVLGLREKTPIMH